MVNMSGKGRQDPQLGHHRMDLRLGRGPQRGQLGPIPHELSQFANLRRGHPSLGKIIAAQPVGQLGGILDIVFHSTAVPVQPQRMHQMHPGSLRLEQIGRPIPSVTRFQRHLGVGARLSHCHRQSHRIVVDLGDTPRTSPASFIRTITDRRRCRSIPTYCCSCSTRVSFRRLRVGVGTPSLPCTLGSRRREELWRSTTDLATTTSSTLGAPNPPPVPVTRKQRSASS